MDHGAPSFLWTPAVCSPLTSLCVKYCVHSDAKAWALVPKSVFGLHEKKMNRMKFQVMEQSSAATQFHCFFPFRKISSDKGLFGKDSST